MTKPSRIVVAALAAVLSCPLFAQQQNIVRPVPLVPKSAPDPTSPPASSFHDAKYGVSFQSPVGWTLTRRDSEVSTFANDAHPLSVSTRMRAVSTIAFNPHPTSTFSGALFYFSVTPRTNEHDCSRQASDTGAHIIA